MQRKLKRLLIILAVVLAIVAILVVSAGGWFYWRYLTASRASLIDGSITISPDTTYHLTLDPKRQRKRAKVLVEFTLTDKCSSVNLSDKTTNKIDYPDGRTILLVVQCVDDDGVKHPLYIELYASTRLFWVFRENLPKRTTFRSLEITSSGKQTLVNIIWIDCHPM